MSLLTVNGDAVLESGFALPRLGVWQGWFRVDASDAVATGGAVAIDIADSTLVLNGTARRAGVFLDTVLMRVVGGKGGMPNLATPKYYSSGVTVGIPLSDLLAGAGETLAGSSDAATLHISLATWTTLGLQASRVLSALLEDAAPTVAWRFLPNGTLWVGPETWPDSALDDYAVEDSDPALGLLELAVGAPLLQPGTLLEGQRVSRVEHAIDANRVHTTVYVEAA